jgi:glucosamine--fructose-6-phosphate aminotransferase (isomerizing)
MCGIVAKISKDKPVKDFLLSGLQKLETRGYDGYGIYIGGKGGAKVGPKKLEELRKRMISISDGLVGIAHNRWATHGGAEEKNSHPHTSGPIHLVHNGQVTNHNQLRQELVDKGYVFLSETDTEVLAHLVHDYSKKTKDIFEAVQETLLRLEQSAYGLVVIHDEFPDQMVVARLGSPVLIGTNGDETFVASQEGALFGYVEHYGELNDGDIVLLGPSGIQRTENVSGELKTIAEYPIDPDHYRSLEKKSEYWMYDEMISARETLLRALNSGSRARIDHGVILGGILDNPEIWSRLSHVKRFIFVGCGTSHHAGKIMALAMEEIAGVEAQAIIASEWIYRTAIFDPKTTCLVAVSQSGETADVRKLLEIWKMRGVLTLGIVNVPNTQIPKLTDAGIYCQIGKEVGVASTKAFLGQVTCGLLFVILMAQQRGLSITDRTNYISEILELPRKAQKVLLQENHIKHLAHKYSQARDFLFIGRKYNEAVAMEGALKLKEISYIHAEGYASGEMKHGPLAMIDNDFPSFVIAPKDSVYDMTLHNAAEIHARHGKIIMVTTEGNNEAGRHADDVIFIPETQEVFSPLLSVITTQMFAFFMALEKGNNPDQPRNLAKSVTVE